MSSDVEKCFQECEDDILNYVQKNFNFLKSKIEMVNLEKYNVMMDNKLHNFIDISKDINPQFTSTSYYSVPEISKTHESLKEKEFTERPSLLTEMLEVNHIKTIYNIFVAILIVFSLNTIVFDFIEGEKFVWDFQLITYSLGQFPHVIVIWCCLMISTILILFPIFRFWVLCHMIYMDRNSYTQNTPDKDSHDTQNTLHLNQDNKFQRDYDYIGDSSGLRMRNIHNDLDRNGNNNNSANNNNDWVHYPNTDPSTPLESSGVDNDSNFSKDASKSLVKVFRTLKKCNFRNLVCTFWLFLYVTYQILFLAIPIYFILMIYDLPPASSFLIMLEQLRLLMKVHSFVHENIVKVKTLEKDLKLKKRLLTSQDIEETTPNFSKYLYFLFAPTLIYRDNYPRTNIIRWNYVVSNLAQVLTCLFYTYYIFVRFCIPVFKHFNQDHLTPKTMILSVFGSMLPGTMVLIIAFFGVLHSWLNAFAEMLRFADRMFYKDWWNSTSFTQYYRTWNVVVHDWLYIYVYRDLRMFWGKGLSRPLAMLAVFQISALAHELVIAVAFRFFYPVLLVMFGIIGFAAMFISNKRSFRASNILLWVMMFMGNGLLMTLYSMEWYARRNCRKHLESKFADFFVPRSWYCQRQT
ncbi:unnamed protein product [Gordionus sp. m RMFG-2023]|uniref:sterol O-acyltransferase 1-like isoform X3 n=1 Tax=Gordionus sp. m RMFG-2023 TaxID=3053472 RepID=UPI0030E5C5CF